MHEPQAGWNGYDQCVMSGTAAVCCRRQRRWRQCRCECMLAAMPLWVHAGVNACWRQCRCECMLWLIIHAGGTAAGILEVFLSVSWNICNIHIYIERERNSNYSGSAAELGRQCRCGNAASSMHGLCRWAITKIPSEKTEKNNTCWHK